MSRILDPNARRARKALAPSAALLAGLLAAAALPAAATELYQWKDAKGVTHYSDSPPPNQGGVTNRVIKNRSGTASQTTAVTAPGESAQCISARANLKQLQGSGQVGVDNNGDGKPDNVLDAQQRAAQVQLAEASIRAYCTPAPAAAPASPSPRPADKASEA